MKNSCLILLAVCQLAAANSYPNLSSGSTLLVESEVLRQRMAPYYGEIPSSTVQVKDIGKSVQEYSTKTILDEKNKLILASIPQYAEVAQTERLFAVTPESVITTNSGTQNISESTSLNVITQSYVKNIPTFDFITGIQMSSRTLPETTDPNALASRTLPGTTNPNIEVSLRTLPGTTDPNIDVSSRTLPTSSVLLLDKPRTLSTPYFLDSKNIISNIQTKNIPKIDNVYTPDVFTIRLEFDWNAPHGQWMTQLLKDAKAAKAAGDTETYKRLSVQYTAWADKYLLKGTPPRVMK